MKGKYLFNYLSKHFLCFVPGKWEDIEKIEELLRSGKTVRLEGELTLKMIAGKITGKIEEC